MNKIRTQIEKKFFAILEKNPVILLTKDKISLTILFPHLIFAGKSSTWL